MSPDERCCCGHPAKGFDDMLRKRRGQKIGESSPKKEETCAPRLAISTCGNHCICNNEMMAIVDWMCAERVIDDGCDG